MQGRNGFKTEDTLLRCDRCKFPGFRHCGDKRFLQNNIHTRKQRLLCIRIVRAVDEADVHAVNTAVREEFCVVCINFADPVLFCQLFTLFPALRSRKYCRTLDLSDLLHGKKSFMYDLSCSDNTKFHSTSSISHTRKRHFPAESVNAYPEDRESVLFFYQLRQEISLYSILHHSSCVPFLHAA